MAQGSPSGLDYTKMNILIVYFLLVFTVMVAFSCFQTLLWTNWPPITFSFSKEHVSINQKDGNINLMLIKKYWKYFLHTCQNHCSCTPASPLPTWPGYPLWPHRDHPLLQHWKLWQLGMSGQWWWQFWSSFQIYLKISIQCNVYVCMCMNVIIHLQLTVPSSLQICCCHGSSTDSPSTDHVPGFHRCWV